ncbi:MAG TPA: phage tail protein [Candidatus Binataceae bacterium]|nr:phage tail protein [Candidatus Binataceae bacterium]
MAELTPAPSINDARTQGLMPLIARLGALDLTPLLVYRVDSVPAAALPFLAWQFDIISPFYQLVAPVTTSIDALTSIDSLIDIDTLLFAAGTPGATNTNELAARELIKSAILLHRTNGTPYAIKQALAALGWATVTLLEGQSQWGGSHYPSNQGWAVFRVLIEIAAGQGVSSGVASAIGSAVNFFKPARSLLDSVWFVVPATADSAPAPADLLTLGGLAELQIDAAPMISDGGTNVAIQEDPFIDTYGPIAPLYNAHYRHSGMTYGQNEPVVSDPALILNGVAILNGG